MPSLRLESVAKRKTTTSAWNRSKQKTDVRLLLVSAVAAFRLSMRGGNGIKALMLLITVSQVKKSFIELFYNFLQKSTNSKIIILALEFDRVTVHI